MATRSQSGGNAMTDNQMDRHGPNIRQHRSQADLVDASPSNRSKTRSGSGRESSNPTLEDLSSKRYTNLPAEEASFRRQNAAPHEKTSSKRYDTCPREEPSSKRHSNIPTEETTPKGNSTLPHEGASSARYRALLHEEQSSKKYNSLPRPEQTSKRHAAQDTVKGTSKQLNTLSRENVSSSTYSRDIQSDIESRTSHRSRSNAHNNDLSRRRSSRHYEDDIAANDLSQRMSSRCQENDRNDRADDMSRKRSERHGDYTDQSNGVSRRRSSRHYDNDMTDEISHSDRSGRRRADHLSSTNISSSSAQQEQTETRGSRVNDRRNDQRNGSHSAVTASDKKGSSSGCYLRGKDSIQNEEELRYSSHKSIEHQKQQPTYSNQNNSLTEHKDHGRRSKGQSGSRENVRDPHDRRRSSSQVRNYESETVSYAQKESQLSHKDNNRNRESHETNIMEQRSAKDESSRRRSSRSDHDCSDDRRDPRSRSRHEPGERSKTNHHRDGSETRDEYIARSKEQHTRRRSSSISRVEGERHDAYNQSTNGMSHSTLPSSSKQNLPREENSRSTADLRYSRETDASKQRSGGEHRHTSVQSSRSRNYPVLQQDANTRDMIRQSPTSASDISKDISYPGNNEDYKRQERRSSNDRQNLQSTSAVHRNPNSTSYSTGNGSHRSSCPRQESTSRPSGTSSRSRRSRSPGDELAEANVSSFKHDSSLSRRSSSSRSNHDTGFASSSSSPKRDESHSKFISDVSPSPHVHDESPRSRAEETRRRRRSKLISNNSLDVPVASLRKEQSLSSSGRGDSSFEEPYAEGVTVAKDSKRITEENKESTLSGPDSVSAFSRRVTCEGRAHIGSNFKLPDTSSHDNLAASKRIGLSNTNMNDTPKTLSKADLTEISSSTSTLRDSNVASKTSISDSISSILGRSNIYQQFRSNQSDGTSSPSSISDKWRKLRQGILPDKEILSESLKDKKASTIFYAAATRFMNSISGVQNTISKNMQLSTATLPNGDSNILQNEPGSPLTKTEEKQLSNAKTEVSVVAQGNSPMQAKVEKAPSTHSVASVDVANGASQRPSIISTAGTLTSHNKRLTAYALMMERAVTPGSEASGEETPPDLAKDMKRRSKEIDTELTSFLPAEMSKREEKFHEAARVNDTAAVRSLLKEKVNINCRNSLDRTALHWATANGNLDAAEILIQNGADLEAKDKYGMRAVLWAAWFGHVQVLKALINAGAKSRVTNKQGLGILHCAAENNHVAVVSFIFEALEHYDVNLRDKHERTPLHSAVEGGHVEAVNRLLEAKADLHKKDKCGMTAVHLAAKYGHIEVLKALLLQGVEVDDRDVDGKTALHLAAEAGHKEAVDLLLDYTANPNSETVKEVTPLHLAAQEGHVEVCRSLLKYGLNVNAKNFQGNSALHIAASGNHKEVARILIDAKCEVDLSNNRMQTPLHVAVESGHLDVVQVLLAGGASLDAKEKSGKSALQLAARGNFVAVVDMLIKAERYYANAREYHDKDVGYVDPDTYLRNPQHPHASQMKDVLWKLAMKQLKPPDWKKLAYHWHFTPEHVKAIEQEYTGTTSYKEHSYRLLNIWLHGVRKDENVLKLLFEALVAIDRKQLAESVRRKVNIQAEKPCSPTLCSVS